MKFLYMAENMDKILNKFEEINQQFSLINLNTDIKYYDKWCFKEKYINVNFILYSTMIILIYFIMILSINNLNK